MYLCTMVSELSQHFHREEKQNLSHYHTYFKGCVNHYLMEEEADTDKSGIWVPADQKYLNGVIMSYHVLIG